MYLHYVLNDLKWNNQSFVEFLHLSGRHFHSYVQAFRQSKNSDTKNKFFLGRFCRQGSQVWNEITRPK